MEDNRLEIAQEYADRSFQKSNEDIRNYQKNHIRAHLIPIYQQVLSMMQIQRIIDNIRS
jgi:hypothetical protein